MMGNFADVLNFNAGCFSNSISSSRSGATSGRFFLVTFVSGISWGWVRCQLGPTKSTLPLNYAATRKPACSECMAVVVASSFFFLLFDLFFSLYSAVCQGRTHTSLIWAPTTQCVGRFWGIIGQNPSASKSNRLHVFLRYL